MEEQVEQPVLVMVENVTVNDKVNYQCVLHHMSVIYDNSLITKEN